MDMNPFIKIRRDLHQIPELGFQEYKTQKYVLTYLSHLPEDRLEVRIWETGIVARVKGKAATKTIGYRTDMDGLPIQEETELFFTSLHSGNMHACGHDMHMSIALGVLSYFVHHPIDDHLVFIFQPAEEGPGGAEPMIKSGVISEWKPDIIFALHIAPEYPVGTIAIKPGLLFANTSELVIDLKGLGGHAAYPHQTNDMVVAACLLVTQLQSVVARNVDPLDSAVLTMGKISGGTVENVIAERARLEGTIRTLSDDTMIKVKDRITSLVRGLEVGYHCEAAIDFGSMYYQVYNNKELTLEFMDFVKHSTDLNVLECKERMTGEDFGFMLRQIPGFMFWLGVNSHYGLHHSKLIPDERAIPKAIEGIIRYVKYKGNKK